MNTKENIDIENNVIPAVKTLAKKYNAIEKTTLNRMRTKPDAYKILISCLLSLRAKDETTEKISEELYKIADKPQEILNLPTEQLEKIIFSTGHYRKKAQTLKHVSKELIDRFDSKVPETREELMSIKGIGPKTANIVLAFAFNQPVIPVDTHVHRIPNRIGWINTKTPEQTEEELMRILPKEYWADFNAVFVQFGRDICQPVSPWCSKCPVKDNCKRIGVKRSR
jgi:endonuclease III